MAAVFLEFVWKVDYADGFEGAFFDAYAASAAEFFADNDFVFFEADGFYVAADHGAVFYAYLVAFFGFAFVVVHYGDAGHGSSAMKGKGTVINHNLNFDKHVGPKP